MSGFEKKVLIAVLMVSLFILGITFVNSTLTFLMTVGIYTGLCAAIIYAPAPARRVAVRRADTSEHEKAA